MRIIDAQDEFFLARRPRKDSHHTVLAYRRDLHAITVLLPECLDAPVPEITMSNLTTGVLRRAFGRFADTHAKSSVLRCWSTWNQFLTFCVTEGHVAGNPMAAVRRPSSPLLSPKPLRGEESPERLLAVAESGRQGRYPWPERDLLVLALGLLAGLRSAEMRALTRGSVVGRAGEQRLHVKGKGNRERSIPMEQAMTVLIESYLASCRRKFPQRRFGAEAALLLDRHGEPIGRGGLEYVVRCCYRAAGLHDRVPSGANLHALRHTFATRLAEDGASASEIQALLGHASLAATQNYIEAAGGARRAAAASNRTYRALRGAVESSGAAT